MIWQLCPKQGPVGLPSLLPIWSNLGVPVNPVLGGGAKSSTVWLILEPRRAQTQRCGAKGLVFGPLVRKSYEARKNEKEVSLGEDGQELVNWGTAQLPKT